MDWEEFKELSFPRKVHMVGVVVHAYNPNTWEAESDCQNFQASRHLHKWDPVQKKEQVLSFWPGMVTMPIIPGFTSPRQRITLNSCQLSEIRSKIKSCLWWGYSSVVQCQPGTHKVLSLILSEKKKIPTQKLDLKKNWSEDEELRKMKTQYV